MKDRLIARIGVCAAAAIFAASVGVLIIQNAKTQIQPARSIETAQIQSSPLISSVAVTPQR